MHERSPQKPIEELYNAAKKAATDSKSIVNWTKYGYDEISVWASDRYKSCTDLFWFATDMLGYDLVEFHRLITTEFFIQKDPNVVHRKLKHN